MTSTINPAAIPLYHWAPATGAALAELLGFQRYPLKTYYLQRNYGGQTEPRWHLVNEPYDYGPNAINNAPGSINEFYMQPVYPNPSRNISSIRFYIPRNGHVSIEIMNANGRVMDVLVSRQLDKGTHTVSWNSRNYSSGLYISRMQFDGAAKFQKMMVSH